MFEKLLIQLDEPASFLMGSFFTLLIPKRSENLKINQEIKNPQSNCDSKKWNLKFSSSKSGELSYSYSLNLPWLDFNYFNNKIWVNDLLK